MIKTDLDGQWLLKNRSDNQDKTVKADVPGSVLDTWFKSGIIDDPYYRENEKSITPLFDNDFEYSRAFFVTKDLLEEDIVELVCGGIDTLGEIFINDTSIARVDNMHRIWRFNVKSALKPGENTIRIVLFSPNAFIAKAFREGPVTYLSTGNMAGANYIRKPHCQFGWDWGPRLPDAGIWRSIYLEGWSAARLEDVYVIQEHSKEKVTLRVKIRAQAADLKSFWAKNRDVKAALHVTPPQKDGDDGTSKTLTVTETLSDITAAGELTIVVEKPQLWQPNGLAGSHAIQPLYGIKVELLDDASVLDCWQKRIGLRTMTISTEKDNWGSEFTMKVNGIKIFAMGANYIPEDSIFPRINRTRTRRLLEECIKANFNCIRIWGGGYYPDDYFYDICDELGLIVWQDFMFACHIYEFTDDFAANVAEEVRQNIIRIRHHPSLGLWCGNNELEEGWVGWENFKKHSAALKADYIKLFESLIPKIQKETDPQTFYWPASPSSGGSFDAPNDPNRGDVHFWEVWHGLKPFSEYRKKFFRFCSEFGFESLPDMETIKNYAIAEDLNLFSPVMESHQKNPGGNGIILYYLSETYRYPKDFASLVYLSQALQMKSIQSGVDHWRQNRGRCMGAIYWQLNDCWPVSSWSSIDYFGRWKALHYGARRFFAPLRATLYIDENETQTVHVFVHNDTIKGEKGVLSLYLRDREFNTLAEENIEVELASLAASQILEKDYSSIINTTELRRSCFVTAELRLKENSRLLSRETSLFVPPKYFSFRLPEYKTEVSSKGNCFIISLKADTFCHFVRIKIEGEDPVFSDNYFDITGKEAVEILVQKDELKKTYTAETLKEALACAGSKPVFSVADSY